MVPFNVKLDSFVQRKSNGLHYPADAAPAPASCTLGFRHRNSASKNARWVRWFTPRSPKPTIRGDHRARFWQQLRPSEDHPSGGCPFYFAPTQKSRIMRIMGSRRRPIPEISRLCRVQCAGLFTPGSIPEKLPYVPYGSPARNAKGLYMSRPGVSSAHRDCIACHKKFGVG
jgi:hypothetical protein